MGKVSRTFIAGVIMFSGIIRSGYAQKDEFAFHRDQLFDTGWKFIRDSVQGAEKPEYDDSGWITLDLPHDYSIMNLPGKDSQDKIGPFSKKSPGNGNSTGQVIGGTGWYRKSFTLGKADKSKTVMINFDGTYMESEVWVNGRHVGIHMNGYTPFWFDITTYLSPSGKVNVIAVKVDNIGRNSRWYSGSGIYRNVHLTLTQPVHVAPWGIYVTTPEIKENSAVIKLAVTIRNDEVKEADARMIINIKDKAGRLVTSANEKIIIAGKSENITNKLVEVKNPQLWSIELPDLYTAEIKIEVDNKVTDVVNQPFGIRSINFSAEKGFLLNGKQIKLKGGCMHHDNGLLGSAAFDRAEVRKVELMKANGYNAIRCAHNPPSEVFLNACDKLGMLVIDEFTDMWENYKNPQDYSRFFRKWWNKDLTDMILRDRNHPGIIMWSIGNEIYEKNDSSSIRIAHQLSERVRKLDDTRPVTQALTDFFYPEGWDLSANIFKLLDVCGYNYGLKYYESDHQKYPKRIMFATESYPLDAFDYWKPVEDNSYIIGDFVWSSMDYIGEVALGSSSYAPGSKSRVAGIPPGFKLPAGINIFDLQVKRPSSWPEFVAWCGDIDITGEKKPQMLYREVLWNNSKLEINVHEPIPSGFAEVLSMWAWPNEWPSWNWKGNEGRPLQVRVFTKALHVKLELNGKIVGEKDMGIDDKYIATFEVPYEPGELKAVASDNGKEVASKILKTTGDPVALRLVPDCNKLKGDRNDLSFVKIEVVDANGQLVPQDSIKIKLSITGNGELIGTGNASPNDMNSVNKQIIRSFNGRSLAIIRPFATTGIITLKAESQGLKAQEIVLHVQADNDLTNNR
jgi:beta-galactosidase